MNLDSLIKRNQLPWRPRPEVEDLDVWHEYEIPLVGTFRLRDEIVLFTQVVENSHSNFSAWAYVCLNTAESEDFEELSFPNVDELRSFIEGIFADREAVLALAKGDRIDHWTRKEVRGSLLSAVEEFLNDVIYEAVHRTTRTTEQRVMAKIAGLEAAQSELADV
jgi:hypothetical protein